MGGVNRHRGSSADLGEGRQWPERLTSDFSNRYVVVIEFFFFSEESWEDLL